MKTVRHIACAVGELRARLDHEVPWAKAWRWNLRHTARVCLRQFVEGYREGYANRCTDIYRRAHYAAAPDTNRRVGYDRGIDVS